MSVRILTAFALALLAVTAVLKAQSVDDRAELRRLNQEAAAAHARKDFPAFLELSRQVVEKAPRSVGALYNLACAELYYVANSQYRFVGDDGTLDLDRLQPPVILRQSLPWIR